VIVPSPAPLAFGRGEFFLPELQLFPYAISLYLSTYSHTGKRLVGGAALAKDLHSSHWGSDTKPPLIHIFSIMLYLSHAKAIPLRLHTAVW
jgi:hypothetical protein